MSNHTEKFMRTLSLLALLATFLVCSACVAEKNLVKEHAVISIPDGSKSRSINLGKVVVMVPRGHVIGQVKAGFACFVQGSTTWKGGVNGFSDSDITTLFFEELKRNNYNVVGDPTNLFATHAPDAEITVAGLVTNLTYDVCYPNATAYYIDQTTGTAKVGLTVEWQVYSNLEKRVILRSPTTGEAERSFTDGNVDETFILAFMSAIQGLLADQRFYDAVVEKSKPAGNFGGLSDAGPTGSGATRMSGPSAGAGLIVPAKAGQKRTLAEVQKAVVVLELQGYGSGVLIGDEGYILTNHHVVNGLDRMRVTFQNGAVMEGTVVKSDKLQDVALVKVDSPPVKGLPLYLEDLAPGTEIYAVGAPLETNLQGTITRGIVSHYRFKKDGSRWLQSDTSVTNGNSGGPIVDSQGRVVGLTSFGRADYKAISYFVPIADGLRALGVQTR